jgi:high-affinity Fe2+/Pb2+ permease
MAKEEQGKTSQHKSSFPWVTTLLSLLLIIAGAAGFFNFYTLPKLTQEILLAVGGIWMLLLTLREASGHERRNILKKYF